MPSFRSGSESPRGDGACASVRPSDRGSESSFGLPSSKGTNESAFPFFADGSSSFGGAGRSCRSSLARGASRCVSDGARASVRCGPRRPDICGCPGRGMRRSSRRAARAGSAAGGGRSYSPPGFLRPAASAPRVQLGAKRDAVRFKCQGKGTSHETAPTRGQLLSPPGGADHSTMLLIAEVPREGRAPASSPGALYPTSQTSRMRICARDPGGRLGVYVGTLL